MFRYVYRIGNNQTPCTCRKNYNKVLSIIELFFICFRLEDFLNDKELDVIKQENSRYENLKNRVIYPMHKRMRQTIVIQCLVYNFDLYDWLKNIGECIRLNSLVQIWIGFSLLVKDELNNIVYVYSIRQLSSFNFKCINRNQFQEFIAEFKNLSLADHLDTTFISAKDDNPFYKSGFRPHKLVCNYIWIRK